jgi:hypothetical protein
VTPDPAPRRPAPRRRGVLAALAMVLLFAPAACGVPATTTPVAVGQAPGVGEPAERSNARLPGPNGASGPKELVQRFLQAAAKGDWDAARDQRISKATEYLRTFLAPDVAKTWQPKTQVVLVEAVPSTVGVDTVTMVLKPVGVLNPYGSVEEYQSPTGTASAITHQFNIQRDATSGEWRITNAPPQEGLLLSTEGLATLYAMRPIYFWDTAEDRYLVADPRYLANGVPREKRVREVVERLLQGPSTWLDQAQAVRHLPPGTNIPDNPVLDSKIHVNLSVQARSDPGRIKKITWQLRWSLHQLTAPAGLPVELQIDNRPAYTDDGDDYRASNPSASSGANEDQRLYGVAGGKVVPVKAVRTTVPVLAAPENADVVSAAVRRDGNLAALVRRGKGGAPELWIGRYTGETSGTKYVKQDLKCAAMSRPALLPGFADRVLVVCDGQLMDVSTGAQPAKVINLADGAIRAISVAPDGRRLALVTGDKVYIATVTASSAPVSLGTFREVYPAGFTNLKGVAWSAECQLVVAGTVPGTGTGTGTSGLVEVSIDNASRTPVTSSSAGLVITSVAAVPRDPLNNTSQPITVEAGNQAYFVFASNVAAVKREPAVTDPSPPPSGAVAPPLSAPFYLE